MNDAIGYIYDNEQNGGGVSVPYKKQPYSSQGCSAYHLLITHRMDRRIISSFLVILKYTFFAAPLAIFIKHKT